MNHVTELRKGVAQHTLWIIMGVIMLILTGALFYVIMPHSDCDRQAELSAQEVKNAIECTANHPNGKDPVTGKDCTKAVVKLCQENTFTMYGIGFVQAYLGLMVPEYMIYYQQFPTRPYKSLLSGGTWGYVESYPFERAYMGQRPYDVRSTLTQFKQFFKTKYLQEPCTDDKALCFNVRGREEVVRIDANMPDVRLERPGFGFAETNPKFYLVAPCYAEVDFHKGSDGVIYGYPKRLSVSGASNFCFTDETAIKSLMAGYTGEAACEVGMLILDFLSLGSKKAVEEGVEKTIVTAIKVESRVVAKEVSKDIGMSLVKKYFGGVLKKYTGIGLAKQAEEEAIKTTATRLVTKMAVKDMTEETGQAFVEGGAKSGVKLFLGREALSETAEVETKVIASKVIGRAVPEEFADATMSRATESAVRNAMVSRPLKEMGTETQYVTLKSTTKKALMSYDRDMTEDVAESYAEIATQRALLSEARQGKTIKEAVEETVTEAIQKSPKFNDQVQRKGFEAANKEALDLAAAETTTYMDETAKAVATVTKTAYVDEFTTAMAQGLRQGIKGMSASSKITTVSRAFLHRYASMEGLPTRGSDVILKSFAAIPCFDVDVCRAAMACGETLLWPGIPFQELTSSQMKGGKPMDTVSDVFSECCIQYNYGLEKNPDKINCTEPAYLADIIKTDLGLNKSDVITLTKAGDFLGLKTAEKIKTACSLAIGENDKECRDAQEMKERHLVDNCIADVSTHTYDFGDVKGSAQVTAIARIFDENCSDQTNIILEISNDTNNWVETNRTKALKFPADTYIYIFAQNAFRYLRIREDGACYFDSSHVVIDPLASRVIDAYPDTEYPLSPGFNYFKAPPGYFGSASKLCGSVNNCTMAAKWMEAEGGWQKWSNEAGTTLGENFAIKAYDRIGIYVTEASSVEFKTGG